MARTDVDTVLRCYPQIYFACHRRHVRDEKTGEVMSQHQASVLDHLDDTEGTALFDLARHMGVTASTMSLTVDRLERGGWVTRERSKQDARRVELRLTEAGARIKKQQKVLEPDLVRAMLARLEDGKRKKALRGLELMAQAARELVESGEMTRILRGVA
ncbi:MAG TPA: MarR family transcriptional regulator [Candidatus Solibacter sp.]|nr:MarR family transcriptional regulator [Candidatus Solibacter sp.]